MKNVFYNLPNLYIERIILRKIKESDVDEFFYCLSNEDITKYMFIDRIKDIGLAKKMIRYMINGYKNNRPTPWIIALKENDKMIGICGFSKYDEKNKSAEIGYLLNDKYWKKGIITEALETIMDFGFNYMQLNKIEAKCINKNIASEKVMLKLNMKLDKIFTVEQFDSKQYIDIKLYSIFKKEYKINDSYKYEMNFG